jgi:hypothetical protein
MIVFMETPVGLDMVLRHHQTILRIIEELLYSDETWAISIGGESFMVAIEMTPDADGVRVTALIDRPCAGYPRLRPLNDESLLEVAHPVYWDGALTPTELRWDLVVSEGRQLVA